jgi:hypothetical protein
MNLLIAVENLVEFGGKIRRASWPLGEWVALQPGGYPWFYRPYPPTYKPTARCKGQPTVEDILADDWEWSPGAP